MNPILHKHLPRRTVLKGLGGVLGLPLLDAMIPALSKAAVSKSPTRMAVLYFPNGVQVTCGHGLGFCVESEVLRSASSHP